MLQSGDDVAMGRGSRAEIIAWALYDWANSAFSTILITVIHQYLTRVVFAGSDWGATAYAWGISASMITAAVLSPVVGALADVNKSKRRWLAGLVLPGATAALVLAFVPASQAWLVVLLFVGTALCFELSLGIYNAFLPEIADENSMNRVSAWGFALGYIGGAVALILALVLTMYGPKIGLATLEGQLRAGIAVMGVWWGVFSLPAIFVLRDRGVATADRQPLVPAARRAFAEVGRTLSNIRRYRMVAIFLLGFLLYNEGVQTVISQASTFATETPELKFETKELVALILMIQFLALPGALAVGWASDRFGQKQTLFGCLAVWVMLLVAAFFVAAKWQFWILGAVVAMVMGGTQSVSRAIMGVITPPERSAEFFGFFNFSGKATSFMGPFLFGLIFKLSGNPRFAIISLLVFFLAGWVIASRLNLDEGRRRAKSE